MDRPFGIAHRRLKYLSKPVAPVKHAMTHRHLASLIKGASFDARDGSENQPSHRGPRFFIRIDAAAAAVAVAVAVPADEIEFPKPYRPEGDAYKSRRHARPAAQ